MKLVCRICLTFGDCETASNGKPMCAKCINEPLVPYGADQDNCVHSINFGVTCGSCTKCGKYFELDPILQPSEAELAAQNGVSPYARYEDDNY